MAVSDQYLRSDSGSADIGDDELRSDRGKPISSQFAKGLARGEEKKLAKKRKQKSNGSSDIETRPRRVKDRD